MRARLRACKHMIKVIGVLRALAGHGWFGRAVWLGEGCAVPAARQAGGRGRVSRRAAAELYLLVSYKR